MRPRMPAVAARVRLGLDDGATAAGGLDALARPGAEAVRVHRQRLADVAATQHLQQRLAPRHRHLDHQVPHRPGDQDLARSRQGAHPGGDVHGQATDVVMLIMNKGGMNNLLSSKFKLGGDASAAAGPVGRHAAADTDWKMRAQVLTYSRSRGLFAGLELNGAVIKQDKDSTREFYGRMVPFKTSLKGDVEAPKGAYPFLSSLSKWAQIASK